MRLERIWLSVLTAICLALIVVLGLAREQQMHVASFDLKQTVKLFSEQVARQKNLNPTERQQEAVRFSQALETTLDDYGKAHHVIIFVAPAVITGAKDLTPEIQAAIAKKMRAASEPSSGAQPMLAVPKRSVK